MKILKNHLIEIIHQRPIVLDLFYEKTHRKKPLVIFCHGYKGYKDWGVFGKMYPSFLSEGFALLTFNFSHNGGTPQQPIDFPDLEAFGNNNYSKELNDLQSVINWVFSCEEHQNEIDLDQIFLIGHSRGGGMATLTASRDSRIKKLVTWAAVSTLDRTFFHGDQLEQWKKEGVLYIANGRTKQQMPHYIQFYEDYSKHEQEFNIELAAKQIDISHLIIHGNGDLSVPLYHAENLHRWNPNSELKIVPNANHVFGAKQPWTEKNLPKDFELVLEKTLFFLHH